MGSEYFPGDLFLRIALVHDWLTGMRGGEKVLSLLCSLMPDADLFTLIHTPGSCDERIESMNIKTSSLDDLPGVRSYYRYLLPLMPLAIEGLDASKYDLIVSSSHCVAKGITQSPETLHICYCHCPARYIWAQSKTYRQNMGISGLALWFVQGYMRAWDKRSSSKVDQFIANSRNIAAQIKRYYGKDSKVIHPPIDTTSFTAVSDNREDYYLIVSALAPYKRVDLAIDAFARLGRPLRVIGSGQLMDDLMRRAPSNVMIMGWQPDEVVRQHYRRCRALIFPGEEDFGLVPLEAMACGAPVIAYGGGGALETVLDLDGQNPNGPTGIHFTCPNAESLVSAVERFEANEDRFSPEVLSGWAGQFGPENFLNNFKDLAGQLLADRGLSQPW